MLCFLAGCLSRALGGIKVDCFLYPFLKKARNKLLRATAHQFYVMGLDGKVRGDRFYA